MNIIGLLGITDVVLVLTFIIMLLIGWKRGFLEKFIKIANMLFGLMFAILFAGKFASFIGPAFLNEKIQPKIYENVIKGEAISSISDSSLNDGVSNVLKEIGFPEFLSNVIASAVSKNVDYTAAELQHQIALAISNQLTRFIVIVISFFLLLFGTTILVLILKIIIRILRTSLLFRTIDGILGVLFMLILFFVFTYTFLLVVSLLLPVQQFSTFSDFMIEDMQLNNDSFRLSKYLYENNIIANLFKIFF